MKKFLALVSFLAFAAAPGAARAAQFALAAEPVAVPVVDTFEDAGLRLRLIGLPSPDGASLQVTLVYEDEDAQALSSVTVDPSLVATTNAEAYNAFLAQMDPGFVSFVRASLADRLMHLRTPQTRFERAESAIFFPGAGHGSSVAHNAAAEERGAE